MDSRDLLFFVTVAEELHFARAAARLYIVPATVTQRVRALEADLGVRLFNRTSRRVALTPAGRRLLEPARGVLQNLDAMSDLARSLAVGSTGHVRVAFAPNLGTIGARFTAELLTRLPGLETVGESMWSSAGLAAVSRGDIAAAIVRGPVDRAGLRSTIIGSHHDGYVALAQDDPLGTQHTLSVQAFQGRPFLITERSLAETVHDSTVAFFASHGVAPGWRHHRLLGYEQIGPCRSRLRRHPHPLPLGRRRTARGQNTPADRARPGIPDRRGVARGRPLTAGRDAGSTGTPEVSLLGLDGGFCSGGSRLIGRCGHRRWRGL